MHIALHLILIQEENVNGCGDFADVPVQTARPITPEDKEALSVKLAELKRQMQEEDACFDGSDGSGSL